MLSIQQAAERRGVKKGNVQAWLRAKRQPLPADALVLMDGLPTTIPYSEAHRRGIRIERVFIRPDVIDAYQPGTPGAQRKEK